MTHKCLDCGAKVQHNLYMCPGCGHVECIVPLDYKPETQVNLTDETQINLNELL